MKQPFRILIVEDNQDDVDLLKLHLRKLDMAFTLDVVDQQAAYQNYLKDHPPDLIICDYNLPGFTGIEALEYVRKQLAGLPFILVSGYIGEEKAMDAMQKGASDYILKDNLERIALAVKREIIYFREHKETQEELDEVVRDLKERVKEQKCLFNISSLDDHKLSIHELLQKAVSYLPPAFVSPSQAAASIEYDKEIYQTANFTETGNFITVSKKDIENGPLIINVNYIGAKTESNNGSFLDEEYQLLKTVLDNLALKINRILNQKELQEKQDLLQKAYNLAEIGNWELNIPNSKLHWSPTTKEIHEVPGDYEPDLKTAINFYKQGKDLDIIRDKVNQAIEHGKAFDVELKIVTAKNNERWIRAIGEPEFADGKCVRLFGAMQNIDKRKRAEEALQKSEQRFKILVQDGSDLISIIDSEGYYKYVSPTSQRVKSLGMDQDEFVGLSCFDFIHEDDRARVRKTIAELELNERKEIQPYRFKNPSGEWRWLETNIINLTDTPAVNGYVANSRDVTDRIEQERKLRDIVENSTNLFYRHDTKHAITYISPQAKEFLGCSPEEAKKRWTDFATDHPENEKGFQKTIEAIDKGIAQDPYELQLQKVTGECIWVEVNEAPIVENGKTVAMVGSLTDITARKQYEEQLEELSLVASKTTDIIIITDEEERITWVNKAYENLTGYTMEESLGKIPGDFLQGPETNQETVKRLSQAVKTERTIHETILNYAKEGTKYWLDIKIDPIFEDEKCTGFIAIERDVTEEIERKIKLEESLNRFEIVSKATSDVIWDWDLQKGEVIWNKALESLLGYEIQETDADWWYEHIHPEDRDRVVNHIHSYIDRKINNWEDEYRFLAEDGTYKHFHDRGYLVFDDQDNPVRMIGSMHDVTDQKEYAEKLEELSLVASKTTDIIIMTDENDKITWINNAFEKLLGYSFDESIGKMPGALLRGAGTDTVAVKRIQKSKENHKSIQEVVLNYSKDGKEIWLDMTADPIFDDEGEFKGYIAIDKDVTEQIRQQRKLQESVERYEIVTKATSDTVWDADFETDTVTYNSNIYEVFGYDEEEVENSGEWWLTKVHPDDRERVGKKFKLTELVKTDRVQIEYRFQCADGTYKYINDRAYIITDEEGEPVRMIGAMQDITKQKEENMWLKLLESAIGNTKESIAILEEKSPESPGRRILYVNDAFEKMTGFKEDDVLGSSLLQLIGPTTDRKAIVEGIQSLNRGEPCELEITYSNKDEKEKWAQISFAPVRESESEFSHWICIGRDVTERRESERELRESLQEKETLLMEIHHRVKNNLAVVSSMMQLQAMDEPDESLQKKLYDSVARIRTMVTIHELLYESGSFAKLDFADNLKKLVSMIIETIKIDAEVLVNFDIEEVYLNVNQAIPTSLIVNEIITNSIKHAFTGYSKGRIDVELREHRNQVKIKISDKGKGLPVDFDPNDTSSLGLQLINVLSKQMNAEYHYYTPTKGGTAFEMQFEKSAIKGIGNVYLL